MRSKCGRWLVGSPHRCDSVGSASLFVSFLGLAQLTVGENPITLRIERADGSIATSLLALRLDSLQELGYLEHGGVLPFVIRKTVLRTRQGALDD